MNRAQTCVQTVSHVCRNATRLAVRAQPNGRSTGWRARSGSNGGNHRKSRARLGALGGLDDGNLSDGRVGRSPANARPSGRQGPVARLAVSAGVASLTFLTVPSEPLAPEPELVSDDVAPSLTPPASLLELLSDLSPSRGRFLVP